MRYHSSYKKTACGISITIFIGVQNINDAHKPGQKIQVGEPTTPPLDVVRSNAAGHFHWLGREEMECWLQPPYRLPHEANNSLASAQVRRVLSLVREVDNVD